MKGLHIQHFSTTCISLLMLCWYGEILDMSKKFVSPLNVTSNAAHMEALGDVAMVTKQKSGIQKRT